MAKKRLAKQRFENVTVQEMARQLSELPQTERPLTAYEVVKALLPEISVARGRGHQRDAIVQALATRLKLSPATLAQYIARAQREIGEPETTPGPAIQRIEPRLRSSDAAPVRVSEPPRKPETVTKGTFVVRPDSDKI